MANRLPNYVIMGQSKIDHFNQFDGELQVSTNWTQLWEILNYTWFNEEFARWQAAIHLSGKCLITRQKLARLSNDLRGQLADDSADDFFTEIETIAHCTQRSTKWLVAAVKWSLCSVSLAPALWCTYFLLLSGPL